MYGLSPNIKKYILQLTAAEYDTIYLWFESEPSA